MTRSPAPTQLVLHVGRSKTGTTALQRFLAANRDGLLRAGLQLPDFFVGANHADLAIAYSERPGVIARALAVEGPDDQRRLRDHIDDLLRDHVRPGQTWLFTSEHLSTRLRSRDEVAPLLRDLRRHFDRISVVAQVRRPDHLAPSLYAESIKDHGVRMFDAGFIDAFHRHFDQVAFTDRWSHDTAELVLLPYVERYRTEAEAFFADWLTEITRLTGVDASSPRWILPDRPANASLSAAALEYLRQVNISGQRAVLSGGPRRKLISALRAVPGPPPPLSPAALEGLRERGWLTAGFERGDWVGSGAAGDHAPHAQRWQEWFDQPQAPVGMPYQLTDLDSRRIADICRQQGASPDGTGLLDRMPAGVGLRVRRAVIRLRRW